MTELKDLIAKLETASEGSRELDTEIHYLHTGYHVTEFSTPIYTTGIDAALMLVEEGWEYMVSNRAIEPHYGRAYLHNRELQFRGGGMAPNEKYRGVEVTAATPALALCIAALKARSN